MSKEIEEMRELKRKQKLLEDYLKTVTQQLRDRGLFYIISVTDPRDGLVLTGVEGRTNFLPAMTTDIISRVTGALVKDGVETRRKLRESGVTETWNDPE